MLTHAGAPHKALLDALARTHGLTSYDAAYLELAIRLGVPLATLDEKLSAAARNEGVTLALDGA